MVGGGGNNEGDRLHWRWAWGSGLDIKRFSRQFRGADLAAHLEDALLAGVEPDGVDARKELLEVVLDHRRVRRLP